MPFLNSIVTRNGILSLGQEVICKKKDLEYDGIPIPMGRYTIASMKKGMGNNELVGIRSHQPVAASWGNLDGHIENGQGLWIDKDFFTSAFDRNINMRMSVKGEFMFRQRNLEGMECRTVGTLPDGQSSFVEFNEHVDGCSADGLGKAGYCIIIPHKSLISAKKDTKGKNVKSKKVDELPEFF